MMTGASPPGPVQDFAVDQMAGTLQPFSIEDLDRTIAVFETVEQLLQNLNPDTWRQDLDSIYTQTHLHYKSRAFHLASRHNKGTGALGDRVASSGPIPLHFGFQQPEPMTDFLEPIFGADTAFSHSIDIIKITLMITNVTGLNKKKTFIELSVNHGKKINKELAKKIGRKRKYQPANILVDDWIQGT